MARFAVLLLVALTTFAVASGYIGPPPDGRGDPVEWGGRIHQSPEGLAEWLEERGGSYERWALLHPDAAARLEGDERSPWVTLRLQPDGLRALAVAFVLALAVGGVAALFVVRGGAIWAGTRRLWSAAALRLVLLRKGGMRSVQKAGQGAAAAARAAAEAAARGSATVRPSLRVAGERSATVGRRLLVWLASIGRTAGPRVRVAVDESRAWLLRTGHAVRLRARAASAASWAGRARTGTAARLPARAAVVAWLAWLILALRAARLRGRAALGRSFARLAQLGRGGGSGSAAERARLARSFAARPRRTRSGHAVTEVRSVPPAAVVDSAPVPPAVAPAPPPPVDEPDELPPEWTPEDDEYDEGAPELELELEPTEPRAGDVERCEIRVWHGYVKSQFYAVNGGDGALAASPLFRRAGDVPAQSPPVVAAHEQLVQWLVDNGWEPDGGGETWYAQQFRMRARVHA